MNEFFDLVLVAIIVVGIPAVILLKEPAGNLRRLLRDGKPVEYVNNAQRDYDSRFSELREMEIYDE